MIFRWNKEKNEVLKKERGVSFEDVERVISQGVLVKTKNHPNQEKYPHQKIFIIQIEGYPYMIPFVENTEKQEIFLKTIIPSRKLKKEFL